MDRWITYQERGRLQGAGAERTLKQWLIKLHSHLGYRRAGGVGYHDSTESETRVLQPLPVAVVVHLVPY
jgi:hypothetical protein